WRKGSERSCGDGGGWGAGDLRQRLLEQWGEAAGAASDIAAGELEEPLFPRGGRRWRRRRHPEPLAGSTELGGSVQAVVADLVEAVGQDVLHEAPEELDGGEGLGVLAPGPEDDTLAGDVEQAAVGDADAMGVAAEVGDDVL